MLKVVSSVTVRVPPTLRFLPIPAPPVKISAPVVLLVESSVLFIFNVNDAFDPGLGNDGFVRVT